MMEKALEYHTKQNPKQKEVDHLRWMRIVLLCILGYEGAGCLMGGAMLAAKPDGRLMDMPVDIMHGVFRDFLIPGIILFALGILTTAAFIAVLRRKPYDWFLTGLSVGGLLIWFWVEIAILEQLHWLHAMWGLPVLTAAWLAIAQFCSPQTLQKTFLVCGILSSVLYIAVNIIVPLQYPGYSSASNVPSELSAIGAPTRMLWSVLATPYTFLMLAFAWGVWKSSGAHRRLRIAGVMMLAYGALGFLWPFAPMNQREVLAAGKGTLSDTMHLALGAATQVFYLGALGFAAAALGKTFRIYSIVTLVLLLFFGILTFNEAPNLSKNLPTPYIGVWERINIGVFLLWVIVLAIILLKKEKLTENYTTHATTI